MVAATKGSTYAQDGGYSQDTRAGRLVTSLGKDVLLLVDMMAEHRINTPFTITVEAFSVAAQPVHSLLGTSISVQIDAPAAFQNRWFNGVLWEYEELGRDERGFSYRLILRPEIEFMTLNRRNRIFQQKSVLDIVAQVLTAPNDKQLSASYAPLDYCVQYQESDWAFISRLMEHEGIYYFFVHDDGAHKIVLIDDRNAHTDLATPSVPVRPSSHDQQGAFAWDVTERRGIGPAKVTVDDYDFETPTTVLLKSRAAPKILGSPTDSSGAAAQGAAGAWSANSEIYAFPAKYDSGSTAAAERYSAAWLDSHRRRMARSFARAQLFSAAVGRRLKLEFDNGTSTEYLIIATSHHYSGPAYDSAGAGEESLSVSLELMPAADQYRPEHRTPRPRIPGPQTALVVGPAGEEIHTDKYGRIKIQFPWDREGKKDDGSSCFVRVVQSAAGAGWGSFALPRIGQEVVVEFLDGDPDRPLVTGAVYNGSNAVPEALPANKTQFGLKTRITKGGGGYNRLWFEDKKGGEIVWFRAERDYKANIVNADEDRLYDKGNRKTTFQTGNDDLILDKGNLTTTVSKGDETRSVDTGKRTTTINGNETLEVKQGNRAAEIKMGNDTLKVSMGNVDIKVSLGSHKTDAMQSIELVCGGSKVKLDPMSISLEAMTISIKAQTMLELKGLMIQSDASAMQIIKGGLVMIN